MSKPEQTNVARTSIIPAGYFQSTGPDSVEVTVYQQGGQVVVRELRAVRLQSGPNQVYLEGMPTQYQPNSLTLLDYEGAAELKLGPVSYRAANLDKARVLQESIGARVTVKEQLSNGRVANIGGTLKAVFGNEVAVERGDNKRIIIVPASQMELDEGLPAGLSATPSLMMLPTAKADGQYKLRLLYEAGGMAWQARYSAFYDEKRSVLTRFEASVAVTNQTGARFHNALVRLLAGSNYGRNNRGYGLESAMAAPMGGGARSAKAFAAAAMDASVESVGEAKMYSLPERVTIANGETQQVTLFLAHDVPVKREYFLQPGFYEATSGDEEDKLPVYVRLRAVNAKDSKLGAALPAGDVNIFQSDSSGSPQKVGAYSLGHVAEGEKFKIEFGPSSDVKAQRRLIDAVDSQEEAQSEAGDQLPIRPLGGLEVAGGPGMPGDRSREIARGALLSGSKGEQEEKEPAQFREEEREITVFNYKSEAVEVHVAESVAPGAEWLKRPEGHELIEDGPGAATIRVKVAAKGSIKLRYRVRWQTN